MEIEFIHFLFFEKERYDLSSVGRLKINSRLKLDADLDVRVLTSNDINIERQNFETCKANVIMKKPFKFSELVSEMKLNQV